MNNHRQRQPMRPDGDCIGPDRLSLALPPRVSHWSLTTLRDKLIKIGANVVHHARQVVFQMAEVAVPRPLFAAILRRIERLRLSPPPAPAPP